METIFQKFLPQNNFRTSGPYTSAEGGVAEVRGEPADQPGCPEEQPGHGAGSQDAGALRPRGARGASCGHGGNLSTSSVLSPSPVTGTERCEHFHPRTTLQLQVPEWPAPGPALISPVEAGREAAQAQSACPLLPRERSLGRPGGALDQALGPHSPRSTPLPVHNRMCAGWAPCL